MAEPEKDEADRIANHYAKYESDVHDLSDEIRDYARECYKAGQEAMQKRCMAELRQWAEEWRKSAPAIDDVWKERTRRLGHATLLENMANGIGTLCTEDQP